MTRLRRIAPRAVTLEELRLVNSADHVERTRMLSGKGGGWVDSDTYVTPRTFDAARTAMGALLTAADHIVFPG